MVKVQTKLNAETTKRLNKRGLKNLSWVIILFTVLFLLMGVCDIVEKDNFGWFYIVMGVLFFPLCLLFTKLFQKIINKSSKFLSEETTELYTFDEAYFILEQTREGIFHNTLQANYNYLFKVVEETDVWFLYISNQQAHVVPKSGVTEGTVQDLNNIFSKNLGARFTTKR